jgi:hypothetical protein
MKQQYAIEISQRLFCRTDKNYMRTVRGARLTALRLFLEEVFSSDHNNNLK